MSNFHVGQMVVCIDDVPVPGLRMWTLKKGRIYTIREIGLRSFVDDSPCIRLEEIVDRPGDVPYWERRFRPVRPTNIEVFHKLVAPHQGGESFLSVNSGS